MGAPQRPVDKKSQEGNGGENRTDSVVEVGSSENKPERIKVLGAFVSGGEEREGGPARTGVCGSHVYGRLTPPIEKNCTRGGEETKTAKKPLGVCGEEI